MFVVEAAKRRLFCLVVLNNRRVAITRCSDAQRVRFLFQAVAESEYRKSYNMPMSNDNETSQLLDLSRGRIERNYCGVTNRDGK